MFCIIGVLMMAALCRVIHADIPLNYPAVMQGHDEYCDSEFMCHSGGKSGSPVCVSVNKVCNGEFDCANGADEHDCPPNCGMMGMTCCTDGRTCARMCDGVNDCPNGEDENDCSSKCRPSEYRCKNGVTCLPIGKVCDGKEQCPMGDDETECSPQCLCSEEHYLCTDGKTCIPLNKVCDSIPGDCPHGDDETHCPSGCNCSDGEYQCESGLCIDRSKLCDGTRNCPDNDDEGDVICARWWTYYVK